MADIEKFVYYDNGSKKVLKPTDRIVIGKGGLAFEGNTDDNFETTFAFEDPTADRTLTFPDLTGRIPVVVNGTIEDALGFAVRNESGVDIPKGSAVYINGVNGEVPTIARADADGVATMPAIGITEDFIGNNNGGYVVSFGNIYEMNTTGFSVGDSIYVGTTPGSLALKSQVTGSNAKLQNLGQVVRVHENNGIIKVGGAGRSAATPNLDEGKFFIGNASNQSVQSDYKLPTTLTNNAILVANNDGSSVLSTDLLTIDTENDRIGIGTSSPARTLHLVGDVQYEGSMRIDQYHTSADGPDVLLQKARGTVSTPTAVSEGDELGKFVMYGHNGTSFLESAVIRSKATVNGSTYGGTLEFDTGTGGTISNRLKIDESGVITFNDAYTFPTADGTANQVLQTDGTGSLSFATISSGIAELADDTTPQLGGTLDLNSQTIQGDLIPSAADTYDLGSVSAEWANIFLGDDAEIKFGLGQDVVIKHIHNSGLRVEMSSAQVANDEPNFTLYSTKETGFTTGPKLSLQSKFVDNSEVIGGLDFKAGDFTTPVIYAESNAQIKSNSSSLEEGKYDVKVVCSGLLQTGLSIEPLNNSSTPSVKISDNYYLPNSSISEGQILKGSATSGETTFGKLSDTIMAELSIPGLDLQTDTNAFRFNCPVDIDIVGLDLYLDQHSTSGDVTVTVTNTTTSSSIQSLTISGTSLSANAYPYTTASAGDVITFAITTTPANAQGLRAVLHIERKA